MKNFIFSLPSRFARYARMTGSYAMTHKLIAGIATVAVLGGGYWTYSAHKANATTTQYVLTRSATAPIESTITASGQVAANHQLDLSPKASGEVTGVTVKAGDTVTAGQVIATIDATDAQKTVRDAQLSLESAQISYTQSITSAKTSITNGATSIDTAKDDAFDAITTAENQFASITQGLDDLLLQSSDVPEYSVQPNLIAYTRIIADTEPSAEVTRDTTRNSYNEAVASYQQTFALYQAASRDSSSPQEVLALLASVQDTSAKVAVAVKDVQTFLQLVNTTVRDHNLLTQPPLLASQITTVNSYASSINSTSSSLASSKSSLTNAMQSYSSNTQSIDGGTPLAVQSAQLSLAKARQSLADAQSALADYVVKAPFAGTIAEVDVQKFDQASGKVATLITNEQYADISLNETDIASIRSGQKATLTFDAIDDITIDGTVAQVNQIGTVSQGVTTYTVKIGFDTQDDRIRPGMTVNASIITASKENALVIPSSAIKTSNGQQYVEVATTNTERAATPTNAMASTSRRMRTASSTNASSTTGISSSTKTYGRATTTSRGLTVNTADVTITRVPITTGIESDTMTEITSGLSAGQLVVSQSLNASGAATTQSSGLFGLFRSSSKTPTTGAARTSPGTTRTGTGTTGGNFRAGAGGPPGF